MRATVYHGPRDVRVEEVPDATLREPTDALVRVTHACICGSDYCRQGLQTSCRTGGYWGGRNDGGQGEAVRAPLADGTLVPLPGEVDLSDHRLAAALATLTDVMGTGHHGALSAGVEPGVTAVVVGDGAVGLCALTDGGGAHVLECVGSAASCGSTSRTCD